jgi:hypothetical protein
MELNPVRSDARLSVQEVEEADAPDRGLPVEHREGEAPGIPQAATNALRAFFMRVLAPAVALLAQVTSGNSTIIVPADVAPLITRWMSESSSSFAETSRACTS